MVTAAVMVLVKSQPHANAVHCHSHCSRIPEAMALDVLLPLFVNSNWVKINTPLSQLLLLCNISHRHLSLFMAVTQLLHSEAGSGPVRRGEERPAEIPLGKTESSAFSHVWIFTFTDRLCNSRGSHVASQQQYRRVICIYRSFLSS